jgi:hypothetical protein
VRDLINMASGERAAEYRRFAKEATCHAAETQSPTMRAHFERIAKSWHELADELERTR